MEESSFIRHIPCDQCGSSDGAALYSNGSMYCFVGAHKIKGGEMQEVEIEEKQTVSGEFVRAEFKNLAARKLSEKTLRRFNYGTYNGRHVANYYNKDGEVVAQKFRTKDKEFSWIGNVKTSGLFGQQVYTPTPKLRIILTEGELDALSIAEIQECKYPVVSVPNGAAAAVKDVKKNLEYLMGFEEVVICFDMDEVGQEAAKKVAELFPPKKAKIAVLPLKDASDMLVAGRTAELTKALWDAKPYRPDGILNGNDLISKLMEENEEDISYKYPSWLPLLNEKCEGIRLGELEIYTSGSGMGKSSLIKQLQLHYFDTTSLNQGLIHLEESVKFTGKSLVSLKLKTRINNLKFHDREVIIEQADKLLNAKDSEGQYRFSMYDQFGSVEENDLYSKVRFMVKGLGCKIIWIDHISIIVSGMQGDDERKTIDRIMTNLKMLTQELGCYIGLISHLNNNNTTDHTFETGKIPTLNNLRGSGSLKQLADSVFAISRDQQADTEEERNTALLTVLKHRYTGNTGPADYIYYNPVTGLFEEGVKPSKKKKDTNEDF